eukprot:TRINITY_DN34659_c0_g1_i1.p1 TRINITY_DN34659_c0_g1~~TRINITY_DN34659_c0_g1_i1.p1  ORF type:complete len:705 (+),score=203.79 TRINITY_DN34659_c0_g1_i1:85-2199(+)
MARVPKLRMSPRAEGAAQGEGPPPPPAPGPPEAPERKFSLFEACALNTLNMFGTGPFVSLPFLIASTVPAGPQALVGYVLAAVTCLLDSLVWAELGALYPHSGGSYVYLSRSLGGEWGSVAAFLFVWQQLLSGPMEIASGYAAMAKYAGYITALTPTQECALASALALLTVALLYRDTSSIGAVTVALWAGTVAAVGVTLGVAALWGDPEQLRPTPGVLSGGGAGFYFSLGAAMRFSLYDLFGYYDVCFVGDEVENPRRTIPLACVSTCAVIGVVFLLVDASIISYLPWDGDDGIVALVKSNDPRANQIMGLFAEKAFGRQFAVGFTLLVMYTIFGSSFSLMVGYAAIPAAAARDGTFFPVFDHSHPTIPGLQDRSLVLTGLLTAFFCWFDLELIIGGMVTTRLLVQFVAQSLALIAHRRAHPEAERPFRMPCYPWPCVIQIVMMIFIFATSDSMLLGTGQGMPLIEGVGAVVGSGLLAHWFWHGGGSRQQQQLRAAPPLVTQELQHWDPGRGWVDCEAPEALPAPPGPGLCWGPPEPAFAPGAGEGGWQYSTDDPGAKWGSSLQWDSTRRRRSVVRRAALAAGPAVRGRGAPPPTGRLAVELQALHRDWLRSAAHSMRDAVSDALRSGVAEGDGAPVVTVSCSGDAAARGRAVAAVERWLLDQGFERRGAGTRPGVTAFETAIEGPLVTFRFALGEPAGLTPR